MNAVLVQPMKRALAVTGLLLGHLAVLLLYSLPGATLRPSGTIDWADVAGEGALVGVGLAWMVGLLVYPVRRQVFLPGVIGVVLLLGACFGDVLDEFFVFATMGTSLMENACKLGGAVALSVALWRWNAAKTEERQTLKRDFQRYARISERDGLTGLFNREALFRRLEAALKRPSRVSVLLLDIDNFKELNDTHGHLVGDMVLQGLADELDSHVRACDVCARYGGEEFVVVLEGGSIEVVECIAERIRASFADRLFDVGSETVGRTVSVGVAVAQPRDTAVTLLGRADAAMYLAKRSGKDLVQLAA